MLSDKRCFELYGYDVMIDSHLKPWLIEVNGSPSMTANVGRDGAMKRGMLDDVFTILNLERMYNVFYVVLLETNYRLGGLILFIRMEKECLLILWILIMDSIHMSRTNKSIP